LVFGLLAVLLYLGGVNLCWFQPFSLRIQQCPFRFMKVLLDEMRLRTSDCLGLSSFIE